MPSSPSAATVKTPASTGTWTGSSGTSGATGSDTSYMKERKPKDTPHTCERELWLALEICRVFKSFY